MQHPSTVTNDELELPGDGFLGDYLLYLLRKSYTNYSAKIYPQLLKMYEITPEEWRLLTLLGDSGESDAGYLAKVVGQPIDMFMETFYRMQDRSYVKRNDEAKISLTASGEDMAKKLFEFAIAQETLILSELSNEQRVSLKDSLKHIANSLA